jgi:hypothetical protein
MNGAVFPTSGSQMDKVLMPPAPRIMSMTLAATPMNKLIRKQYPRVVCQAPPQTGRLSKHSNI